MHDYDRKEGEDMTKISAEDAVAAVLQTRTRSEAAAMLGVSESTLYRVMRTDEYTVVMDRARKGLLDSAIEQAEGCLMSGINAAADIIEDSAVAPQIRINGLQALVATLGRLVDIKGKKKDLKPDTGFDLTEFLSSLKMGAKAIIPEEEEYYPDRDHRTIDGYTEEERRAEEEWLRREAKKRNVPLKTFD